jgi:hypothetical protein
VHAHRLRFYEYAGYVPSEEVKEAWIHDETGTYNVQELIGIRDDRGDVEVLVWWQGFEKATAEWHPYTTIKQDVPAMVHKFLRENMETNTLAERMLIDDSWATNKTQERISLVTDK